MNCPICQGSILVEVHGHLQCQTCKNNIQPCCGGAEAPCSIPRQDMKIRLGQTVMTASVNLLLKEEKITSEQVTQILRDQENCKWGNSCSKDDAAANDKAAETGNERCFGVHIVNDIKLWVITEADRSATTVLLPEDY